VKAYKISCRDDGYHGQCVVFADSRGGARQQDLRDCDCQFVERRIVRAPTFDELSPGPVSIKEYLSRGWCWPCGHCQTELYDSDDPVIVGEYVYCGRSCVVADRKSLEQCGPNPHESIVSTLSDLHDWLKLTAESKET